MYTYLTHWGGVTHICVGNLNIIGSDNGLSPSRRQAIIWTNAGILLIEPPGTNFSEILIKIHTFSFKKMHFKMLSVKLRPFCLGLNVIYIYTYRCMLRWPPGVMWYFASCMLSCKTITIRIENSVLYPTTLSAVCITACWYMQYHHHKVSFPPVLS